MKKKYPAIHVVVFTLSKKDYLLVLKQLRRRTINALSATYHWNFLPAEENIKRTTIQNILQAMNRYEIKVNKRGNVIPFYMLSAYDKFHIARSIQRFAKRELLNRGY